MKNRKRIFFDMDGVLAKYNFDLPKFECLYTIPHYFRNRPRQDSFVGAAHLVYADDECELFVLTAVLPDHETAFCDKHDWLDEETPEVDAKHRIFTLCGEDKIAYVPAFNPATDILVDDFGENCTVWAKNGGSYVKVSRDAEDAEHEKTKHRYVAHPGMTAEEILAVIKSVDCGAEKVYLAEYRETYSRQYAVPASSWNEAKTTLCEDITSGREEGPDQCIDSEYIYLGVEERSLK